MLRAGKGTVQRCGTRRSYTAEIDALYRDADIMSADVDAPDTVTPGDLEKSLMKKKIRHFILDSMNRKSIDDSDNFFALGMDSLQALVLVRKLKQSLAMSSIALSTIYTNPSVDSLTDAIIQLSDQTRTSETSSKQEHLQGRKALFEEV